MTNVDRDLEVNYSCHVHENSWYIHAYIYLLTYDVTIKGRGLLSKGEGLMSYP